MPHRENGTNCLQPDQIRDDAEAGSAPASTILNGKRFRVILPTVPYVLLTRLSAQWVHPGAEAGLVGIDSSAQLASAARAAALGIFPIGDLVDVDCELIGLAGANEDTE